MRVPLLNSSGHRTAPGVALLLAVGLIAGCVGYAAAPILLRRSDPPIRVSPDDVERRISGARENAMSETAAISPPTDRSTAVLLAVGTDLRPRGDDGGRRLGVHLPGHTEPIDDRAVSRRPERLLKRHINAAAFGERRKDSLRIHGLGDREHNGKTARRLVRVGVSI